MQRKIDAMTPVERRKYDLQQKRQARMEADLEPERKMRQGMEDQRCMLDTCKEPRDGVATAVMFERLRGIVLNEEDDT